MKRFLILILLSFISINCTKDPTTLEELKDAGIKAFSIEDYKTAKEHFLKGLQLNSSEKDILFFLGVTYKREYRYDSAMLYLKRADLLYPANRELNQEIYDIAIQINDYENALKAVKVFIRTGSSRDENLLEIADLNLKIGNKYLSYLTLKEAIEIGTDDPKVYLSTANVAGQIDSVEAAVSVIESAIEKFGQTEELLSNYSIYLAGADRVADAEKVLRKQLETSPNPQPIKLNLATILTMYNTKEKKLEAYKLYKELYDEIGDYFGLDSTIKALEKELDL